MSKPTSWELDFEKKFKQLSRDMLFLLDSTNGYHVVTSPNETCTVHHMPTGDKKAAKKIIRDMTRMVIKAHKEQLARQKEEHDGTERI